ncbi:hypothetical protein QE152_g10761 [Popillia japonica]|uniref:Ankyrin repeat protein n=1 Tax=Popillia japonica TaxID=7064 RepID=A0AAW1LTR4_POPJA
MPQDILNVKQYLREFTVETACSIEEIWKTVEDQKNDHNFKILKISANTVDDVIRLMTEKIFYDTYNAATHWFIIVISIIMGPVELNVENVLSHGTYFDRTKPIIIQWQSMKSLDTLIYFRNAGEIHFCLVDLNDKELLTEEELTSQDDFDFPLVLKALQSNLGGSFNGNLLDITVDVKQEFDTWRLIDYVARSGDSLTLRFLMLFPWDLNERNEDGRKVLEIATEYASAQTVAALLNLPMSVTPETEVLLTNEQVQLLLPIEDINTDTPLTIAVEKGRTDTLTFLINCGIDINCRKKTISGQHITLTELAWNKQRYDNMLALLKADASYPTENSIRELEEHGNAAIALKEFIKDIVSFHRALHEGNTEKVKSFIKGHPRLKKAHDLNNQSALMTALEARQYELFTLLQSKGYTMAEHEDLFSSYEMLSSQQKEDLKVAKLKYFKKQDNTHILFLLSKSKLHIGQTPKEVNQDCFAIIKDLFEQLDEIPYLSTIMKVLEYSESLEINFYFKNEIVNDFKAKITSDYKAGRLHIEVKDSYDTIYRLTHEFICLAIQNVYRNELMPYYSFDNRSENQFKEITNITVNVKREFDTWRLIHCAARSGDFLTLRFLMLFPWNLNERNEDGRKVLEIATEYASPQTVAALLNLPMSATPETQVLLTTEQMQLLLPVGDINTDTPLTIAINCGIDINSRKKTVSGQHTCTILTELAWNKQRFDNMLALLKRMHPIQGKIVFAN